MHNIDKYFAHYLKFQVMETISILNRKKSIILNCKFLLDIVNYKHILCVNRGN